MNPLVSIIIPLYNSEEYLSETMESVLAQTYQNIEVIIVDDGSIDASLSIAKKFENDFIKVYTQNNKGASAARNYGLKESKGDYIQFLDSDDLLAPDKIEKQVLILTKNSEAIISTQFFKFSKNINNKIGVIGPHISIAKNLTPINWLVANHTMLIHAWLTPKHIIEKSGIWDERLSFNDDGEYFARVISNAKEILFTDNTIVYYRSENPNNISTINSETKIKSALIAAKSIEGSISRLTDDQNILAKTTIGNIYKNLLFIAYNKYPNIYDEIYRERSLKYADIQYNAGGKISSFIQFIFGWRTLKYLKDTFN